MDHVARQTRMYILTFKTERERSILKNNLDFLINILCSIIHALCVVSLIIYNDYISIVVYFDMVYYLAFFIIFLLSDMFSYSKHIFYHFIFCIGLSLFQFMLQLGPDFELIYYGVKSLFAFYLYKKNERMNNKLF